jgi:hypothetical protein
MIIEVTLYLFERSITEPDDFCIGSKILFLDDASFFITTYIVTLCVVVYTEY